MKNIYILKTERLSCDGKRFEGYDIVGAFLTKVAAEKKGKGILEKADRHLISKYEIDEIPFGSR